jgi:hypothetical protein
MTQIVLTPEQFALLGHGELPVQVLAPDGSEVGVITRQQSCASYFTSEELAAIKTQLNDRGPRFSTDQVIAHLDSLAGQ